MAWTYSRSALTGLQRQEWDTVLYQILYAINQREHAAQKHYTSSGTKTYTKWETSYAVDEDYRTMTLSRFQGLRIADYNKTRENIVRARDAIEALAYRSGVGRYRDRPTGSGAWDQPTVFVKTDYSLWGSVSAFLIDAIGSSSWCTLGLCSDVTPWLELYDALAKLYVVNVPGVWGLSGAVSGYGDAATGNTSSLTMWEAMWDNTRGEGTSEADAKSQYIALGGVEQDFTWYALDDGPGIFSTSNSLVPIPSRPHILIMRPRARTNQAWPTSQTGRLKRLYWEYTYSPYGGTLTDFVNKLLLCDGTEITPSDYGTHEAYWDADTNLPLANTYIDSLVVPEDYPYNPGAYGSVRFKLCYAAAVNIASELTYG